MKITEYKSMTRVKQAVSIASIILLASGPQLQAQTTTDDEVFLNNLLAITGQRSMYTMNTIDMIDMVLFLGDYSFDEISTKKIDALKTSYVYMDRFGKSVRTDTLFMQKEVIDYNPRTNYWYFHLTTNNLSFPYHDIWSFQCDKRDSILIDSPDPAATTRMTRMILLLHSQSSSLGLYWPDGRDFSNIEISTDNRGRITWARHHDILYQPYTANTSYIRYNAYNRIEYVNLKYSGMHSQLHFNWKDNLSIKSIKNDIYTYTYYYEITERGSDGHWTSMIEYHFDEDGNRVEDRLLKRIISDPVEKVRIADAKRREALRQRQARIDSLISIRNTTEFSIEDLNHDRYSRIKEAIDSNILSTMEKNISSNGQYRIEDKIRISYDGETEHDIKITGDSESLAKRITESVQDMEFKPETIGAPGLDKTVAVNTHDTYELDYTISTEAENLILVKNADGIKVKKGDAAFYNSNKNWINENLSENGVYNLDAWKREINGRIVSNDVTINKIRSRTPNLMLGINYSPIAPIGLIVGYNNIGTSPFGIYGKFDNMNSYVVGATCSITNFAYLACGAGVHKSAILPPELVAEAGIIIRPVQRFGISAGYSYMPGTQSGGFNIGLIISFYLKKK